MLISLHVKNLALIEEEEVTFKDGLNILTGETGAGKSIVIGSVNLALGAKADKNMIRTGADQAMIELIFTPDNESQRDKLRSMDIGMDEEDMVLIKRKIMAGRSICSVNGETVTLRQLREIAESMIDIYGQRENQKLLRREMQLQTVDEYGGAQIGELLLKVGEQYRNWRALRHDWDSDDLDESARKREMDLLAYEIREIEEAGLTEGEDEEIESRYRLLGNFRRLSEAAGTAAGMVGGDGGASETVDRACRELSAVSGIDQRLDRLLDELAEVDDLLSGFYRSINDYVEELTFDPAEYMELQDRLNLINHLKDKYGDSISDIEKSRAQKADRLAFLTDYEEGRRRLQGKMEESYRKLCGLCEELSDRRKEAAGEFSEKMITALQELNFPQVKFEIRFETDEQYLSAAGYDRVSFHISMNPGEALRPLEQIASGGELSRIMLGMKTVFAGKGDVHTFIFDEIDAGISGQTAWMVAQKMGRLARDHQILCITHLPQIAAMEDSHYLIAKNTADGRTQTHIWELNEEESDREVARLVGADLVTEASLENAREMKKLAAAAKSSRGD